MAQDGGGATQHATREFVFGNVSVVAACAPSRAELCRGGKGEADLTGHMPWLACLPLCEFLVADRGQALLAARPRVLELGAGVGLPGLIAGRAASELRLTDNQTAIVEQLAASVRENERLGLLPTAGNCYGDDGCSLTASPASSAELLEWGLSAPLPPCIRERSFDLLLASDCVYYEGSAQLLAETAARLLAPGGVLLLSYTSRWRETDHALALALRGAGLRCRLAPGGTLGGSGSAGVENGGAGSVGGGACEKAAADYEGCGQQLVHGPSGRTARVYVVERAVPHCARPGFADEPPPQPLGQGGMGRAAGLALVLSKFAATGLRASLLGCEAAGRPSDAPSEAVLCAAAPATAGGECRCAAAGVAGVFGLATGGGSPGKVRCSVLVDAVGPLAVGREELALLCDALRGSGGEGGDRPRAEAEVEAAASCVELEMLCLRGHWLRAADDDVAAGCEEAAAGSSMEAGSRTAGEGGTGAGGTAGAKSAPALERCGLALLLALRSCALLTSLDLSGNSLGCRYAPASPGPAASRAQRPVHGSGSRSSPGRGDSGLRPLCAALLGCRCLRVLRLRECGLGDADALILAACLLARGGLPALSAAAVAATRTEARSLPGLGGVTGAATCAAAAASAAPPVPPAPAADLSPPRHSNPQREAGRGGVRAADLAAPFAPAAAPGAPLCELDVSDNEIGSVGLVALTRALACALEAATESSDGGGHACVEAAGDHGGGCEGARPTKPTSLAERSLALRASHNRLEQEGVAALCPLLPACLTELRLAHQWIGDEGAAQLGRCGLVRCARRLETLDLSHATTGWGVLAALRPLTPASHGNGGGSISGSSGSSGISSGAGSVVRAASMAGGALRELHVCGCCLRDAGASALAALLCALPSLRLLDARRNEIGWEGAEALADALHAPAGSGSGLESLLLSHNPLGFAGVDALADGLLANARQRVHSSACATALSGEGSAAVGAAAAGCLCGGSRRVRTLELVSVGCDDEGLEALCAALAAMPAAPPPANAARADGGAAAVGAGAAHAAQAVRGIAHDAPGPSSSAEAANALESRGVPFDLVLDLQANPISAAGVATALGVLLRLGCSVRAQLDLRHAPALTAAAAARGAAAGHSGSSAQGAEAGGVSSDAAVEAAAAASAEGGARCEEEEAALADQAARTRCRELRDELCAWGSGGSKHGGDRAPVVALLASAHDSGDGQSWRGGADQAGGVLAAAGY